MTSQVSDPYICDSPYPQETEHGDHDLGQSDLGFGSSTVLTASVKCQGILLTTILVKNALHVV